MAIQFKDCVDCLKVIFPQFDFAFLFDHSQGHAKKLANGLDAVNVGDTQSFVFRPGDAGPFWMTVQERELNRQDRILPPLSGTPRTRNRTISELKAELRPLNVLNERRQYRLVELQELAKQTMLTSKSYEHEKRKAGKGNRRAFCRSFGKGDGSMKQILKNTPWIQQPTTMVKYLRVRRSGV